MRALWELEVAADRSDCAEQPMPPLPIQFLIATIAAAINDRMARQLEYAQEEVRKQKEALTTATGTERIRFTEGQRRRLALIGKGSDTTGAGDVLPDRAPGSSGQSRWEVDGAGGAGASGSSRRMSSESDARDP